MGLQSKLLTKVPALDHSCGIRSVEVTQLAQDCGETDGLYTRTPGVPIMVHSADYVPILLARKEGGMAAAIHAGWRGTLAHAVREFWKNGEKPKDWVAAIGPCAGPCCYEVAPELAAQFKREFPVAVVGERNLNLAEANAWERRQFGIAEVDVLGICTICSKEPLFYSSHRREKPRERQWSAVRIRA